MITFLKKIRALCQVMRWNFHPTTRKENVAEHSFYVAIYSIAIAQLMGLPRGEAIDEGIGGLMHDAEEAITGDLPHLVKRYTNWAPVEQMAQQELFPMVDKHAHQFYEMHDMGRGSAIVRAADMLAALVYADEEVRRGNSYFWRIRGELAGCLVALAKKEDKMAPAIWTLMTELGFSGVNVEELRQEISHY